jgi:hypothetical protein
MSERMLEILEPKCTSNFIQEDVIALHETQSSMHKNEETNSVIRCVGRNTSENVPAEIISQVNGSQSTNDKQILSDDTAESLHQQHTELSFRHKIDVSTSTEPSVELPAFFPVDNEEPIAFTGRRSMGCQAAGPENLDELYNVGVIKYSSTRNPLLTKLRHSEKGHPTGEMDQQMPGKSDDSDIQKLTLCEHKQCAHERQHARNKTDYIKANIMSIKPRQRSIETSDPLAPPSTYKKGVVPKYLKEGRQRDKPRNETEYRKTTAVSVEARQGSNETASDPFGPPSTYKRGVIPKYLKERREALKKQEKMCKPNFPLLVCPPVHVIQNYSYRSETLKVLKKRYSDLAEELRMMPVKTDIRMMYSKKIELTKKLKETEKAIKMFYETVEC